MIHSALNYTGGKFRLLDQLLPQFPLEVHTFVDLFCGGCSVGLNAPAAQTIFRDIDPALMHLLQTFRALPPAETLARVYDLIGRYRLSLVSLHGYAYYSCDSSRGLADYNRAPFLRLRQDYNALRAHGVENDETALMLYVLMVYAFNNQLRFNSRGQFNLPVGKRDFNRRMEAKLTAFLAALQEPSRSLVQGDFRSLDFSSLTERDLVYADPPYLIARATYNEQGGWGQQDELDLLAFLDELHSRHLRFALSNVLRTKGRENRLLLDWLARREGSYRAIDLVYSYSNSSYHTLDRSAPTQEVLIVNY